MCGFAKQLFLNRDLLLDLTPRADFQAAAEQGDLAATDEAFLTYCMRFAIA